MNYFTQFLDPLHPALKGVNGFQKMKKNDFFKAETRAKAAC